MRSSLPCLDNRFSVKTLTMDRMKYSKLSIIICHKSALNIPKYSNIVLIIEGRILIPAIFNVTFVLIHVPSSVRN